MKTKNIPMRLCTGCGTQKPKRELVRVVRSKENVISLDTTGKMPGRGAYICPDVGCLLKAKKAKRLERVFGCAVPDAVYAELEEALQRDG